MYRFDPTFLQVVLAGAATLVVGYLAAWAVVGGERPARGGERTEEAGGGRRGRPGDPAGGDGDGELETRQKAILWTGAAVAVLFLLWWATLSTGSGGRPPL